MRVLACVASVAAYSAKLQTHLYQTTDLWHDADVPSLRPVPTAQSPAATKLSLLAMAPDNEDPNNTTYCVAHSGQTMVDDKWCFMSCNNVPPNCPKELCDCVKGVEAKKKVDKVKGQMKEQPAEASQAKLAERDDGGLNPSRVQEEDTAHKLARLVHRQQAVHQKEVYQNEAPWQPGQLGVRSSGVAQTGPPRVKSDAERKYDESQSAWAVKDYQAPELTVESKSVAMSFLQTEDATQAASDQHSSCGGWAAEGECAKNPTFMASECAESCSGTEAAAAAAALADWGELQRSAGTADSKASSVNLLQAEVARDAAGEVLDADPKCVGWAAGGECTKNPSFMASSCAFSCRGQLGSGSAPSAPASVVDLVQPQQPQQQPQQQQQQQQRRQQQQSDGAVDSRREFAQAAGLILPDEVKPAAEASTTGAVDLVAAAKDGLFQDLVAAVAQTVVDKKGSDTKAASVKAAAVHAASEAKSKSKSSKSKSKSADAPAKVEDDTDGANLTTNSTKSCPFCGYKEIPNCCSKGEPTPQP